MPNPAWYNDNQFRDYPFLTRVLPMEENGFSSMSSEAGMLFDLPKSAVLDFGAIMEIDADYDESAGHIVYLHSVSRAGSVFTFKLRTNAPHAANYELVFRRNLTDPEFSIEWEEASTIEGEEPEPFACPTRSKWRGFMVSGNMKETSLAVADGETFLCVEGLWQIEPARVQSLMKSYLRAVSLANMPRIHATPPAGCSESSSDSSVSEDVAIPNALCLDGNLQWKEGYNCTIRQDVNNNAIIIGAGVGVGAGQQCEEVPLYPGETPPDDSPFLSGGPACNEIIKSINGVSGDDVTLIAGPGFRISASTTDPNTLVVDRALDDFAICGVNDGIDSSVSASSESSEQPSPADNFSAATIFNVTALGGLLADDTINPNGTLPCIYNPSMSLNGVKTWTSKQYLASYWNDDSINFCGFRYRYKVTCDRNGLVVSIVIYPLADNNQCRTYVATLGADFDVPVSGTFPVTLIMNSTACDCINKVLAENVQVTQVS